MKTRNPYRRLSEGRRPVSGKSATRKRRAAPGRVARREEVKSRVAKNRRMKARRNTRHASRRDEGLFEGNGEFNPQRYSLPGRDAIRNATKTNRRMFDKSGQINAQDSKDALTQISHLLSNVTKTNSDKLSFYNPESEAKISKEARRDILAAALQDPSGAGWHMVGQELALPIKAILDYEGFARKFYRVRTLGQAELFRIPVDIRSVAYVVGQDGQTPEARIRTKWITPTEFKVASFPTIDIHDIYLMNFDVLDRAQDTARQEIELKEDKAGIAVLDAASTAINTTTTFASLGIGAFEDVRYQVERHRLMVEHFMINRAELSDIVKTMSTAVDPVTERELILAGYIGSVLNSQILTAAGTGVEEVIPAGTFYATTGPDYLGEMGIRMELQSEPFNQYALGNTTKGLAFVEIIGFGLVNSRSCAKGSK